MVKGKVPAFSWLLAWMQFRGWHGGRSLRHLRDFVLKKKKRRREEEEEGEEEGLEEP